MTSFSAPSNVKVGLDYIMKNADNEVFALYQFHAQQTELLTIMMIRFSVLLPAAAPHQMATDAGWYLFSCSVRRGEKIM